MTQEAYFLIPAVSDLTAAFPSSIDNGGQSL